MLKNLLDQKVNLQSNNLNLLRLLLATLVLFYHLNNIGQYRMKSFLFTSGDEAVKLFFIVSGFLIYYSFDKDNNLAKYASRRIFRIFPLYVLVVIIQFLIMFYWAISDYSYTWDEIIKGSVKYLAANLLLANFLNYQLLDVLHGISKAINGSLWSIKVEVMFYVLIPFLAVFFKSSFKMKFLLMYALSLVIWYVSNTLNSWSFLEAQLPSQLFWFLLGMALYKYRDAITLKKIVILNFAVVFIGLIFLSLNIKHGLLREWIYFPCIAFTIVYLFSLTRSRRDLKYDISYGVYLIHWPVIVVFKYYGLLNEKYWVSLLYIFLLVYLLSGVLHLVIEKPFIEMGKNYKFNWLTSKNT